MCLLCCQVLCQQQKGEGGVRSIGVRSVGVRSIGVRSDMRSVSVRSIGVRSDVRSVGVRSVGVVWCEEYHGRTQPLGKGG